MPLPVWVMWMPAMYMDKITQDDNYKRIPPPRSVRTVVKLVEVLLFTNNHCQLGWCLHTLKAKADTELWLSTKSRNPYWFWIVYEGTTQGKFSAFFRSSSQCITFSNELCALRILENVSKELHKLSQEHCAKMYWYLAPPCALAFVKALLIGCPDSTENSRAELACRTGRWHYFCRMGDQVCVCVCG